MKELDIVIPPERLNEVNEIVHKHKVGGMYFDHRQGSRFREELREVVAPDRYQTGKRYIPEFGSRTVISMVVSDDKEKTTSMT